MVSVVPVRPPPGKPVDDKSDFVNMLNRMRCGELDGLSIKRFQELKRPITYDDGIEATELLVNFKRSRRANTNSSSQILCRYPLRYQVETANAKRLNLLPSPSHNYSANDTPGTDIRGFPMPRQQAQQLLDRLVAVKELTLKVQIYVLVHQARVLHLNCRSVPR